VTIHASYIKIIPQTTPHFNELTLMICGVFYYDFGLLGATSRKREREALPGVKFNKKTEWLIKKRNA